MLNPKTEQEVITEAFVRRIGAHAMLQSDGSIKIGFRDPNTTDDSYKSISFLIKFKHDELDVIVMEKE